MEKYCISLEQAKKLEGLGASAKFGRSQFEWCVVHHTSKEDSVHFDGVPTPYDHLPIDAYDAYHVGELGEILPDAYSDVIYRSLDRWIFKSWEPHTALLEFEGEWSTEAQARGALLIYLLEHNLL